MHTVPQPRPFARPVKTASHVLLHCGGQMTLTIGGQGVAKSYTLRPLASDFGRAFTLESRVEGKTYHVNIDGRNTSCTCPGFLWTGGCKHCSALLQLLADGRL